MPCSNLYETHPGFARMFQPGRLTLGMMLPMAPLVNGIPDMRGQLELAAEVDRYGFSALWVRDVPADTCRSWRSAAPNKACNGSLKT